MNKRVIVLLFSIAFMARLGLLVSFKGTGVAEQMDAKDYHAVASSIIAGRGFVNASGQPTETRPPAYPLFLAGIYAVAGNNDFIVKLAQCLLDSFSVLGIYLIACYTLGKRVAFGAGVMAAVYPPMILYSNLRLSETLFTFLLVVEILLLIRWVATKESSYAIAAGVSHGAAVLCRSTVMFFPFFLLVLVLALKERKTLLKGFVFYVIISSCIVSLWTIRNYVVFREFVPVNRGGGYLMWFALQKDAWQGDKLVELSPVREYPDLEHLPMVAWDNILAKRVMQFAFHNPASYMRSMARNEAWFWYLPVGKVLLNERSHLLATLYQAAHLFFLLGAVLGLVWLPRGSYYALSPLLLLLFYAGAMHSIVLPVPRYRLPFDFMLILLCANGSLILTEKFWRQRAGNIHS